MKSTQLSIILGLIGLVAFLFVGLGAGPGQSKPENTYLSPEEIIASPDGKILYIAQVTAKSVAVFDVASKKVVKIIPMPGPPTGLAHHPSKKQLLVTCSGPVGKLVLVDTRSGKVIKTVGLGHTPIAPQFSPNGKTIYLCDKFNNQVVTVNAATLKVGKSIKVIRQPVATALTSDGKKLVVANLLPAGSADGAYLAAIVSIINTTTNKIIANISLPNGSNALHGVAISPDGRWAFVTHILGRYHMPTTQLERGWMNTNALSVIDLKTNKLLNCVLLDEVNRGAANPWSVACTPDGKQLLTTHAGTHEISIINLPAMMKKLLDVSGNQQKADEVPNDLAFLVGLRQRIALQGNGARGLVIVGSKAYVTEYFSASLACVTIGTDVRPDQVESIRLGNEPKLTQQRQGEIYFADATLCFQNWQSCISCHPDTRVDSLNWDLLNDGFGNPKNTKNMLLSHKTPPAMSTGIRANAKVAVRAGLRHIQFAVRPEKDAKAIDAYLLSLQPTPSPYLVNGKLSQAAKRGKKVYQQADCAYCHTGPYYTDMKLHDMGTGKGQDLNRPFDTPSLIETWRTAPYMHDGRSATLKQMLTEHNPDDKHGKTSNLTEQQLNDLVEYLLSL